MKRPMGTRTLVAKDVSNAFPKAVLAGKAGQ
jgi:hypothetical protein